MDNYVWRGVPRGAPMRWVSARNSAMIDFAEAAYDLAVDGEHWLPNVIGAGAPVLDHGLGVFALTCFRPAEPGALIIDRFHASGGPPDFSERMGSIQAQLDMSVLWPLSRPGIPKTLSEVTDKHDPKAFRAIMGYFDFAKDALGIPGFDPDGRGVYLILALPQVTALSDAARERWQMLAAHFGAGYRLRRAIDAAAAGSAAPADDLPHGAEVIIDPLHFRVTEARGKAKTRPALSALREAARQADRARGRMRKKDPEKALEMWTALVRGRWSTVDWFDADGRRYLLGVPNPPGVSDPRGLTEREMQVLSYVFFGLTNKMVGYHLGISKGRVSALLSSSMRKLGVETRAQLIRKLHDLRSVTGP